MKARLAALTLAATALLAGCGTDARPGPGPAAQAPPGGTPFLATSQVTAAGTWAVAVMGGSVASRNNFWQLFLRPAGSTQWKLVTPPGTADNGGLVLASAGGQSLITAFRPSQYLTYTPLTITRDAGQAWSPAGPLAAALANTPDALAIAPATSDLLALTATGDAKLAAPGYTRWAILTSQRALAATPGGRRCGLRDLTAATFTPTAGPMLAGTCTRPGIAGIFAAADNTWHATGPRLPGSLARQTVTILRLTQTANRTVALLQAGNGPTASVLAAWSADSGRHWNLSPPLTLARRKLSSASIWPTGTIAMVLNGNQAATIPRDGSAWLVLPTPPAGTATLAPGPSGTIEALAVHGTRLTIWQLQPSSTTWHTTQALEVPIQFGSSG
jgi:hypothetical protein